MVRSIRIHTFGGPEALEIEDIPNPEPGPGEVRLRIRAIGLNRTEATFRSGRIPLRPALPTQLGFEAAGEIEKLGPGVIGFAVGDRVSVIPSFAITEYGLYGEVSLAPARALAKVADDLSWEDAAAIWSAFGTAWCGLIDIAQIAQEQVVLISAASSSVGLAAIQTARAVGAVPVALTRTAAKADSLRGAGAAHIIITQEQNITSEVMKLTAGKGADVIFDAVAGPAFEQLAMAATSGAIAVVYGAMSPEITPLPILALLTRQLTIRGFAINAVTKDDAKLKSLAHFIEMRIASGVLKPTIAKTFTFSEIVAAHRFLESGKQVGKVVVTVP
ncbi:zinc-dependent alcohol dehydrogenase family protein [Methylocapsa sp. S129]|uniref:zinc-dependent alcohol dehydrogenase family protein n=1 Tax=Methylocapsa sp. S129 TaxID=1641869 RepID=UPI00131DD83A|nr:zinc-dependent alcohol dehydrogenase family protein [Methylocapsa sp. S129]